MCTESVEQHLDLTDGVQAQTALGGAGGQATGGANDLMDQAKGALGGLGK